MYSSGDIFTLFTFGTSCSLMLVQEFKLSWPSKILDSKAAICFIIATSGWKNKHFQYKSPLKTAKI